MTPSRTTAREGVLSNHLKGVEVTLVDAQPVPGHYFVFTMDTRRLVHGWKPIHRIEE
jgi:hypothetical protein